MNRRPQRVDEKLLSFAREMRHAPAPAEEKLWWCLRNRRLGGFKFRRQYAVGRYIADFVCAEVRLVIELDGESHALRKEYDAERSRFLQQAGFDVIRYENTDVFENLEGILLDMLRHCERRRDSQSGPSPRPSPPSTGERGS